MRRMASRVKVNTVTRRKGWKRKHITKNLKKEIPFLHLLTQLSKNWDPLDVPVPNLSHCIVTVHMSFSVLNSNKALHDGPYNPIKQSNTIP